MELYYAQTIFSLGLLFAVTLFERILLVMVAIVIFYPNNRAFSSIITALMLMIGYFRPDQHYYFKLL